MCHNTGTGVSMGLGMGLGLGLGTGNRAECHVRSVWPDPTLTMVMLARENLVYITSTDTVYFSVLSGALAPILSSAGHSDLSQQPLAFLRQEPCHFTNEAVPAVATLRDASSASPGCDASSPLPALLIYISSLVAFLVAIDMDVGGPSWRPQVRRHETDGRRALLSATCPGIADTNHLGKLAWSTKTSGWSRSLAHYRHRHVVKSYPKPTPIHPLFLTTDLIAKRLSADRSLYQAVV